MGAAAPSTGQPSHERKAKRAAEMRLAVQAFFELQWSAQLELGSDHLSLSRRVFNGPSLQSALPI